MRTQRYHWILLDASLAATALAVAYFLRFLPEHLVLETSDVALPYPGAVEDYRFYLRQALYYIPAFALIRVLLFHFLGLYRGFSRFAGVHELRQIVVAVSLGTALLVAWEFLTVLQNHFDLLPGLPALLRRRVPIPVVAVDWMACVLLVGGARMARRMLILTRFNSGAAIHNVIIIGASDVGEHVARNFLHNPQIGFRPVGFVDVDEKLWGREIHGLTVYGGLDELPFLVERFRIVEVLVAMPKPSRDLLNRVVEICEAAHVSFKIVPAVRDVMEGRVSINQIRQVEIEDLLGREPADLGLEDEMNYLEGEVVLLTGAGGSIGSELCRQILRYNPSRLLMLGRGENSLYEIATELGFDFRSDHLQLLVADIQDVDRLQYLFDRYRPTVVFHAAAHKHVPLMEMHPVEAVKNNIIGTFNVAYLAHQFDVKRFTLISTDKAVHPTSVMGTSKRVAEMILAALSDESETSFITVRFGNVLGSRGSVIPIFRKQIAAGGPVTVMDPDLERYFMTIPEAASLVIQAAGIGHNGQLFILDMGEPVRILDLARRMVTLSGLEPYVDIDIDITGLRPGEKIREELLTEDESLAPTVHHKIMVTQVEKPSMDEVREWLRVLDELTIKGDPAAIVAELRRIVPEFKSPPADGNSPLPSDLQ